MSHPLFHDDLADLTVSVSELMIATADGGDEALDQAVPEVLRLLRQRLGMDVVFVSEFVDGQRVFRFVDRSPDAPPLAVGDGNPLEESFCQRIVDGRLPEAIPDVSALPPSLGLPPIPFTVGAHLSTPIVLSDGSVYGTLCCFSRRPDDDLRQQDLSTLRLCARLVARKMELARSEPATWQDTAPAPD